MTSTEEAKARIKINAAIGVVQKTASLSSLRNFSAPLPTLEIKQKIVAGLKEYQAVVASVKRLKVKMEARIKAVIDRMWEVTP